MIGSDPVVHKITSARVSLLFNAAFFGNLATRMNLVQADGWCKTAATDGRNLYYNREFIKSLTPEELLFLIAHEVLHTVYDHLGRKAFRDHKIWNMANDYIVNYTLVKSGIGKMPKHGLYDEKYHDGMISEEVYKLLKDNSTEIKMTLDEHLSLEGEDGDDKDGAGKKVTVTVMGDSNGPPRITEADRQQIRNEIKAAVINAAQAVGAGKVPAGVRRLIEAFTNPKMDWRTLLELHIQSQVKDDFTFQRPSRRSWTGDRVVILPGQNFKKRVELVAFIDLSGSMTDEMVRDFLGEVRGIMETFEDFWLLLATFDTKVYNPKVFTSDNIDDIMEYKPMGGGGTDFMSMFEFMQHPETVESDDEFLEAIEPAKLVVFTDGYPMGQWGLPEYCDTLWILHGTNSIVAPFGMTVYYESEDSSFIEG